MPIQVLMPALSPTMEKGNLAKWVKKEGDAVKAVESVFDVITAALKKGDEVRLVGFGTFSVSQRKASTGRNPRTCETMTIKASISEADVTSVKPGQRVYFTILGEPQHRYEAKLRAIEPVPESEQTDTTSKTATTSSASMKTAAAT